MKTRRLVVILLFVLCSTATVEGVDLKTATDNLGRSVEELREKARAEQPTPKGKQLRQLVNTFLELPEVNANQFDAKVVGNKIGEMADFSKSLPTKGILVKAVEKLDADYNAFAEAKAQERQARGGDSAAGAKDGAAAGGDNSNAPQDNDNKEESEVGAWTLGDYLTYAALGLAGVAALSLLALTTWLLLDLRRSTDNLAKSLLPQVNDVKTKQGELGKQLAAFAVVNNGINQRLTDLHGEVRQVSRGLQLSQQNARGSMQQGSTPAASYAAEPVADKRDEMPSFPIAADDLLRRMQPKSMVVKRDFQNDMLVSDPDGKGELVLIRDAHIPDEIQPLFIVPRVTQFQMRQEYHNFYEKYYDCTNPESGVVWIIDPAVVDKVSGGWQLREKGRLEVR